MDEQPRNDPVRDANWARPVSKLKVSDVPSGAINLNVDGREIVSPLQGFGALWQKTYRVRLSGVAATPAEVMQVWKEHFPKFQPRGNHFYPPIAGLEPGQVVFIDSTLPILPGLPGLVPIAAGVMVLYADEVSFTVMTPEGFPESGWNTFSAYAEDGCTVAQVQSLCRATDPIYEFGLYALGGARMQEGTWVHVLTALADHYSVQGLVQVEKVCLDPTLQWSEARNVWHNAAIRTALYLPVALMRRIVRRR
jgi:hypothetical protein